MKQRRPSKQAADWIGKEFFVQIDRPLGVCHPKFPEMRYAVNYGYVPNTLAADGHEVDAYVLGIREPLVEFQGECIAIVHRLDDVEDKLIVVPQGTRFSVAEIADAVAFQEQYFRTEIIIGSME